MKGLIIVDVQNDFLKGGSMGCVEDNDLLINEINKIRKGQFDVVILSLDWHPLDHFSFASNHSDTKPYSCIKLESDEALHVWPTHCVKHTIGAALHPNLHREISDFIVCKGENPDKECFSAFGGFTSDGQTVEQILKKYHITDVVIVGIAYDYCVGETALSAARLGFNVHVIKEATANVDPISTEKMQKEICSIICNKQPCTGKCGI